MIGYFRDATELVAWAQQRATIANEDYISDGSLVRLGYALAMSDIAQSVVGAEVQRPAYQWAPDAPAVKVPSAVVHLRLVA